MLKRLFLIMGLLCISIPSYSAWSEYSRSSDGCTITLTTVTIRVRELIDDSYTAANTVRYSSSTIYNLINTAQKIICINTLCLETYATQNLVNGTTEYALPTNCLAVSRVTQNEYDNNGSMVIPQKTIFGLDSESGSWDTNPSTPTAYYLRNRFIGFDPAPTSATPLITLWYYKIPVAMTSGSDFVFNNSTLLEPYWEILAIYAAYKLYLSEGNVNMANQLAPEFAAGLTAIKDYIRLAPDLNINFSGQP